VCSVQRQRMGTWWLRLAAVTLVAAGHLSMCKQRMCVRCLHVCMRACGPHAHFVVCAAAAHLLH